MTASNTLPLYVKRACTGFLVIVSSYFYSIVNAADPPPDEIKNTIRTVVVDAGHGGKDSGAVGKHGVEKDIALNIALKLGKLIEENIRDVKVVYTRKTDVFIPLDQRAKIANDNKADLFISIHVNSNGKTSPYGTSSHVLGLHRTGENFDVAARENSVILLEDDYETKYQGFDPQSPESYVIFSVMQNTYLKQSIEFASYVQDQLRDRGKRKDRGVVQQGIMVLAQTAMPGALIETGFISNPDEEKFLLSANGQDIISSSVFRAFRQYKSRIEENSNFTIRPEINEVVKANESKAIPPDELSNNDLHFLVQIASSRNLVEISPSAFKGHTDVKVIEQGRWYKYTLGSNLSYHDALEKCSVVKDDFTGAFVIAVKNNKIIPLSEALQEINY